MMSPAEPGGGMRGVPGLREVSSPQNPLIKLIRSLDMRKTRREHGLFVAEGAKVVATARDVGWAPRAMLVERGTAERGIIRELCVWAASFGAELIEAPAAVLEKVSQRDNPQKVLGVFPQRLAGLPAPADLSSADVLIVLEEARDPGNVGTVIRTADAAGAKGVVLVGNCCDPYSREAVRASMGSIFSVPLMTASRGELIALAGRWPGAVVGTHLSGTADFRKTYRGPVLLMMGGEGPGLSPEVAKAATELVKIPMTGRADSLNLAIATALLLYEIRRPALGL